MLINQPINQSVTCNTFTCYMYLIQTYENCVRKVILILLFKMILKLGIQLNVQGITFLLDVTPT